MTNEEREAIELAKEFTKMDFSNPMGWTGYYDTELKELQNSIATVLNMLKEKNKEIEKKDKIIDLMAKYIDSNNYLDNEECQFQWDFNIKKCMGNGDCKDCIKQNFERKSEE